MQQLHYPTTMQLAVIQCAQHVTIPYVICAICRATQLVWYIAQLPLHGLSIPMYPPYPVSMLLVKSLPTVRCVAILIRSYQLASFQRRPPSPASYGHQYLVRAQVVAVPASMEVARPGCLQVPALMVHLVHHQVGALVRAPAHIQAHPLVRRHMCHHPKRTQCKSSYSSAIHGKTLPHHRFG